MLTINKKSHIPYDFLILCTGAQYLITCPPQMDPLTGEVDVTLSTPPGRKFQVPVPEAVLVINDLVDAENNLFNIQKTLGYRR